MSWDGINPV